MRYNIVHFTGDAGVRPARGEAAFLLLLVFEAAGAFLIPSLRRFAHAAGVAENQKTVKMDPQSTPSIREKKMRAGMSSQW